MIDENELKHRCSKVDETIRTNGFGYIEAEWFAEREKIITLGKKAVEEGKTEAAAYIMAELAGFDKALKVPAIFSMKFEELLESEKAKRNEKEQANA